MIRQLMYNIICNVLLMSGLQCVNAKTSRTTILISFDGFRWDFMSKTNTPYMDYIVKTGVKATYINPVFPAETLPNHYSMITGLYPESHGILSGYYTYDPVWSASFGMDNTESRWWNGGEPVWITNQKYGHRSGVCYFPGYDVKIKGLYPSFTTKDFEYAKPFINSKKEYMSFHKQVDTILDWMKKKDPPSFIATYFREPDETAHEFGPKSKEVIHQIQECDQVVGYLLKRLNESNFLETTNLIITSDHGHTSFNTSRFLNFDEYITSNEYIRYGITTIQIWPKHNHTVSEVYQRFKKMENDTKLISVYKIEDFPEKYHFTNNPRVPPIIAIMKEHWIGNSSGFWKIWKEEKNGSINDMKGDHVYRPELQSMKPFFIARGPGFKEGYISQPFEIIDIYPMLCHLLGIPPAPSNGSLQRVKDMFKDSSIPMTLSERMGSFLTNAWEGLVTAL